MTRTRPWQEIRDEVRADPERAARIDALKREMERQIAACVEEEDALPEHVIGAGAGAGHAAVMPAARLSAKRAARAKAKPAAAGSRTPASRRRDPVDADRA
jgi:fructoselysine-6-P-deglycase FrlB-like protein